MRVPSQSRRSPVRRGLAEAYSAVLIVAVTLALSSFVFSEVRFPVSDRPVYSFNSYAVLGSPSMLHVQVNSSSPSALSELRVDDASSLSGILALEGSLYSSVKTLCATGATTFFSVNTTRGSLTVKDNGVTWIRRNRGGFV